MFNPNDPHQFFETYDDNDVLISRWTMDKIKRKDGTVWVMNHFFINPNYDLEKALSEEMQTALLIAHETGLKIWPLDPAVIAYFKAHAEFHKIWYHQPYKK